MTARPGAPGRGICADHVHRAHAGGGGTAYQAVNLLTGRRKNSFRGDGASKEYHLDAAGLDDSAVTAEVDGEPTTAFAVDRQTGVVTFTTAPAAPGGGDDNVVITFAKTAAGYADRIAGCTPDLRV